MYFNYIFVRKKSSQAVVGTYGAKKAPTGSIPTLKFNRQDLVGLCFITPYRIVDFSSYFIDAYAFVRKESTAEINPYLRKIAIVNITIALLSAMYPHNQGAPIAPILLRAKLDNYVTKAMVEYVETNSPAKIPIFRQEPSKNPFIKKRELTLLRTIITYAENAIQNKPRTNTEKCPLLDTYLIAYINMEVPHAFDVTKAPQAFDITKLSDS